VDPNSATSAPLDGRHADAYYTLPINCCVAPE
jgi:hypothetical protein